MKLSEYAKKNGVTYRTAHNHWKKGLLKGHQLPTGTIIIAIDEKQETKEDIVVLYARVSSSENKSNLNSQLNRLRDYAAARGYKISKEVKEIGSGLNDTRPQLEKVLKSDDWNIVLVEHKDRFSRFGLNYINILLEKQGKKVEIINDMTDDKADLMEDFVSLVTSFCARLYGLRRSKRKTEKIIAELKREEGN